MKDIEPDLIVDITLYPTERGGRRSATPTRQFGCPCTPTLDSAQYWDCWFLYKTPIRPGETRRVGVKCLSKEAVPIFSAAGHFYLRELSIIGEAVVVHGTNEIDSN